MFRFKTGYFTLAAFTLLLLAPGMLYAASPVAPNEPIVPSLDRISWAAVIAGAVVALACHMTLSSLGIGLGAALVAPYDRENPVKGIPTMMMGWMFVSGLLSLTLGAWLAGRLAGTVPFDSMIHGLITWALATVVMFLLATTSLGFVIGGTFHLLSLGLSSAAKATATLVPEAAKLAKDAVAENVPAIDLKGIESEAKKLLASPENKEAISEQAITDMLSNAYGKVRDNLPATDRQSMIEMISSKTGGSKEEPNKTLDKWEKMYGEAKQSYQQVVVKTEAYARDTAAATTSAVSRLGIWTFASLLIGAGISALAGNLGSTYFRM